MPRVVQTQGIEGEDSSENENGEEEDEERYENRNGEYSFFHDIMRNFPLLS